jgi:hypothetical protein
MIKLLSNELFITAPQNFAVDPAKLTFQEKYSATGNNK